MNYPTAAPVETAAVVGVAWRESRWDVRDSLDELTQLAETAGVTVAATFTQRLDTPHPATYVGKGKLEEIRLAREERQFDMVIFDDELSPGQLRELEKALGVKIIDRASLILDIFARRAQTHEGRLQVELAQLEYRLPRLTRLWTHLSRQTAGGVGLRGPGETQLESDRREIRARISQVRRELEDVRRHRELHRGRRRLAELPVIGLVGYTNAGKSTLLNTLTTANVAAENKLFATLDPTTRRLRLPSGRDVLVTDTVGFIRKLPTQLVAAFRATLEEIAAADVLVHVLDITHPNAAEHADTVREILNELGAGEKPVITALNKIDRLGDGASPESLVNDLDLSRDYVPLSAHTRVGLDLLSQRLDDLLARDDVPLDLTVPFERGDLVNLVREHGRLTRVDYNEDGVAIQGSIPTRYAEPLRAAGVLTSPEPPRPSRSLSAD